MSLQSPQNALDEPCDAAFDMPIIGYGSALHPLFDQSQGRDKSQISPAKWLESKFGVGLSPDQISVVSWALPMPESARAAMSKRQFQPAQAWILAREKADRINTAIARDLAALFSAQNIHAVAPLTETLTHRRSVEKYGTSLPWSEQVAAVAAGIGAMRPSCGIVTPLGASVVLGSIVVGARLPGKTGKRMALDGACLKPHGCTDCQSRCPIDAISPDGFDPARCLKYQSQFVLPYLKEAFDFEGRAVCDLCITGVPCEFFPQNP